MATREINLIHEKKAFSQTEERFIRIIKKSLPYVLGGYALVLVVVISGSWFLNSQISSLDTKIIAEREQIKAQEKDESRYLLLKQKAIALTALLDAAFPYPEFFDFLIGLSSADVVLSRMEMNATGQLSLVVSVTSTEALDGFVRSILAEAETKFRQVELQNITYNTTNTFTLQLGLQAQPKL